ncbi:hypothetical protein IP84_00805 [beta proteobacterium AAP99]|nr:hypothetical protein IP84_00805 [beta proteobacterium AAP99]
MPSEKLTRILLSKSPFSEAEIAAMSEDEGWAWVYANPEPRREVRPQVCFTGFRAADKPALAATAERVGLEVVDAVTKGLTYLVAGENAGPAKLDKARKQGVAIMDRTAFERLAETGEVPSPSAN